jgi:hypothetical protein
LRVKFVTKWHPQKYSYLTVAGDLLYVRVEAFLANIWGEDEVKTNVSETLYSLQHQDQDTWVNSGK